MVSCCVYGCTQRYRKDSSVSFHKFPGNPEIRRQWIEAARLEKIYVGKSAVVCSDHFLSTDFLCLNGRRRVLREDTVPSIFLYFAEESALQQSTQNGLLQEDNNNMSSDDQKSSQIISIEIEESDAEDTKRNERVIDYIILDDDDDSNDNVDNIPSAEQNQSIGHPELEMKCEIGEVQLVEENLYFGTESNSSNWIQPNGEYILDKKVAVAKDTFVAEECGENCDSFKVALDDKEHEEMSEAVESKSGLIEKAKKTFTDAVTENGKNCNSVVLTPNDEGLEDISEDEEPKSGCTESQSMTPTEPSPEVEEKHVVSNDIKPTVAKAESNSEISSKNKIKRSDSTDNDSDDSTMESIPKAREVWVSNLNRSTRAFDLKKHMSKFAKVITTKIVTDSRKCFGYVVLESCKGAANCINNLNNSEYEGVKITVATSKPMVLNDKNRLRIDKKLKSEENSRKRAHSKEAREERTRYKSARRSSSSSDDTLSAKFDAIYSLRMRVDRIKKDYLREKYENDRLKRKLAEVMKRSKHEKKEIELEWKRLEKEKLELQKREAKQLEEKCKVEKEKISLMRQKLEMERSTCSTPTKDERTNVNVRKASDNYGYSEKEQRVPWNSTQWNGPSGAEFPVSSYPETNYNCNTSGPVQPNYYNSHNHFYNNLQPPVNNNGYPETNYNCTTSGYPQSNFYYPQTNSLQQPGYGSYYNQNHHP